jgi:hypothetical protein
MCMACTKKSTVGLLHGLMDKKAVDISLSIESD